MQLKTQLHILFDQSYFPLKRMAKPTSQFPTTSLLLFVALLCAATTLPTAQSICSDTMFSSLSSSGFTAFAHAILAHNLSASRSLTFLAPPDTALLGRPLTASTIRRHVSPAGAFPYQSLLKLPANTTLPTLQRNAHLAVGTDGKRVSFNGVLVSVPNLYYEGSCAVHGVEGIVAPSERIKKQPRVVPGKNALHKGEKEARKKAVPLSLITRQHQSHRVSRFVRRAHLKNGDGRKGI